MKRRNATYGYDMLHRVPLCRFAVVVAPEVAKVVAELAMSARKPGDMMNTDAW